MSPVFATIRFGPFSTAYHQRAVDDQFREALDAYLTRELLPQVDEPFDSTAGTLTPIVTEERNCGPNSLVRDIYVLEFAFVRPGSSDQIKAEIRRNAKTGGFEPRRKHAPLFLWTNRRRQEDQAFRQGIDAIVKRIGEGQKERWNCPRCGAALKLVDDPSLFDLSCSGGCFSYNFHRDPGTGALRHGHFFSRPADPSRPRT